MRESAQRLIVNSRVVVVYADHYAINELSLNSFI